MEVEQGGGVWRHFGAEGFEVGVGRRGLEVEEFGGGAGWRGLEAEWNGERQRGSKEFRRES